MTAQQRLDQLGITMQQMLDWLAAQTDPAYVLSVFHQGGFTNEMVGEIAGQAQGYPYSPAQVRAAFSAYGLDSSILDTAPIVVSITSPNVMEGSALQHAVVLSSATTVATEYSMNILLGSATVSDFSGYSLSNGVSLASFTSLIVPAGVSTFTLTLNSANDTTDEPNEGYSVYIGGVFSSGIITDNDIPGAPDPVTVQTVGSASSDEGAALVHTVMLSGPSFDSGAPISFAVSAGTAAAGDIGAITFTNGVTASGANIFVPTGVSSFNVQIATVNDTADEPNETLTVTVGGILGTGTILDNDEPPAAGSSLLPTPIDGYAPVLDLNDRTGDLSTLTLRTKVLDAIADDTKYWSLFDPAKYGGSDGGVFTAAELGVSHLGDLPATAETIESLYYGTFLDIALSRDFSEGAVIGTFFMNNLLAIFTHSMPITGQYVALAVEAAADPAPVGSQMNTEAAMANLIPTGMINATANAGLQENVFWGLLNI